MYGYQYLLQQHAIITPAYEYRTDASLYGTKKSAQELAGRYRNELPYCTSRRTIWRVSIGTVLVLVLQILRKMNVA